MEPSFEKAFHFPLVLCSLIKLVEMNLQCLAEQAGGSPSAGLHSCRFSLWSDAIVTVLRTVENLYFGCKRADGFETNGGPFKDASVCILRLRNKSILELLFLRKISFKGLAMC